MCTVFKYWVEYGKSMCLRLLPTPHAKDSESHIAYQQ